MINQHAHRRISGDRDEASDLASRSVSYASIRPLASQRVNTHTRLVSGRASTRIPPVVTEPRLPPEPRLGSRPTHGQPIVSDGLRATRDRSDLLALDHGAASSGSSGRLPSGAYPAAANRDLAPRHPDLADSRIRPRNRGRLTPPIARGQVPQCPSIRQQALDR